MSVYDVSKYKKYVIKLTLAPLIFPYKTTDTRQPGEHVMSSLSDLRRQNYNGEAACERKAQLLFVCKEP